LLDSFHFSHPRRYSLFPLYWLFIREEFLVCRQVSFCGYSLAHRDPPPPLFSPKSSSSESFLRHLFGNENIEKTRDRHFFADQRFLICSSTEAHQVFPTRASPGLCPIHYDAVLFLLSILLVPLFDHCTVLSSSCFSLNIPSSSLLPFIDGDRVGATQRVEAFEARCRFIFPIHSARPSFLICFLYGLRPFFFLADESSASKRMAFYLFSIRILFWRESTRFMSGSPNTDSHCRVSLPPSNPRLVL